MDLRQPIIAMLGHVDHGKTSILDRIRNTAIAKKEAGGITQHIGATEIPAEVIEGVAGDFLKKLNVKLEIPGLLFIDTPGHEAFTSLRKRGGSIADLAVLVIDINEGVMPQTKESIEILKAFKTPFVIAFNKIDRIRGWETRSKSFMENFGLQREDVKQRFEEMFYKVVGQLSELGVIAERFDRIVDFSKTFSIVPVSALTGEGIPELIAIIAGLSQKFLKKRLVKGEKGRGVILEVKEVKGLGDTADIILFDGKVKKGEYAVVVGKNPIIRRVKLLLKPSRITDIRMEKKFREVKEAVAAAGIKVVFDSVEGIVPGSQVFFSEKPEEVIDVAREEIKDVEIDREEEGLIIKADTIGSLEAMIKIFSTYPIKHAAVGNVTKADIIKASINEKYRVVLGFNVSVSEEIADMAKSSDVKIILSNIIYKIQEELEEWLKNEEKRRREKELEGVTRPAKFRVLPGCIFRATNPAIIGVEVLGGTLRPKQRIFKADKPEVIGTIRQIQSSGKNIDKAEKGESVAISIDGINFSRQAGEGDVFYTDLSKEDFKKLMKYLDILSSDEKTILEEIKTIKKSIDDRWDMFIS